MLTKVAVNKREIDKLVRIKRYDEAIEHLEHVKDIIELIANNRVELLVKENVIMESEKKTFFKMIVNNINNKLLEDEEYVLMDEDYIEQLKERYLRLRLVKKAHIKK